VTASSRPRGDIAHATLSVLFIALLGVCTFWVLSPFLTSLLWAIVICIAIWPMLLRLEAFLGGRRWAAVAIMTATILLVVFVPVTLALTTIVSNAQNITAELKSFESVVLPSKCSASAALPEWWTFAKLARMSVRTSSNTASPLPSLT